MAINVPSSTPITIAAVEANSEYFQTFTIADDTGTLITQSNPIPTEVVLSGYAGYAPNYQGTLVPIGGVYINDVTGSDFTELVDGQAGTVRINNRRALMTATDGQVTILNSSVSNNYHDTVVASGSFFGVVVPTYSSFFEYLNNADARQVYIPLSRSGFSKVSLFFRHTLVNDSDSNGHPLPLSIFADLGQFDLSLPIYQGVLSGIIGQDVSRAFICYEPTVSGTLFEYIPAFTSPLAGIFVALSPTQAVTGDFEIYASKGA